MNSSKAESYRTELGWLYSLLNQTPDRTESSSKILYGSDLVKQMMKTKLSDQIHTDTLVKLTE